MLSPSPVKSDAGTGCPVQVILGYSATTQRTIASCNLRTSTCQVILCILKIRTAGTVRQFLLHVRPVRFIPSNIASDILRRSNTKQAIAKDTFFFHTLWPDYAVFEEPSRVFPFLHVKNHSEPSQVIPHSSPYNRVKETPRLHPLYNHCVGFHCACPAGTLQGAVAARCVNYSLLSTFTLH